MQQALHVMDLFREFAQLYAGPTRLFNESSILRFSHLLEANNLSSQFFATVNAMLFERGLTLKAGTVVDVTLIVAPSTTKNNSDERYPEMHQTKRGNKWRFGMKSYIRADAEYGLVHTVTCIAANEHDINQAHALLYCEHAVVFANSGYSGINKHQEIQAQPPEADWQVAMMTDKPRALKRSKTIEALLEKLERFKTSIRTKMEHTFKGYKCKFQKRKTRYRNLVKNKSQLKALFTLDTLGVMRV